MSNAIQEYMDDLTHRYASHYALWVLPLSTGYTTAFHKFKETLDEDRRQREADAKLISDLIVLGVSLPVGGVMTSRLGHAVLGKALGGAAVRALAESNFRRAATVASWLQNSSSSSYIIGEAFEAVQNHLKAETKAKLTSILSTSPLSDMEGIYERPLIFKNRLEGFNWRHFDAAYRFAEDIRDTDKLSRSVKDEIAAHLREQPYFADAGQIRFNNDEAGLAKDIELLMWSAYVLNTDYYEQLVTYRATHPGQPGYYTRSVGSIDNLPSDEDYATSGPRGASSPLNAQPGQHVSDARPAFRKPGDIVLDRVEELWAERISKTQKFSCGEYDRSELLQAENVSRRLTMRYARIC